MRRAGRGLVKTAVSIGRPSVEKTRRSGTDDVLGEEPREVAASPCSAVQRIGFRRGSSRSSPQFTFGLTETCSPTLTRVTPLPDGLDGPDELVAGDQRERGVEVAVVDVQVRATDAHLDDPDPDLAGPGLGSGTSLIGRTGGRRRRRPSLHNSHATWRSASAGADDGDGGRRRHG